MNEWFNDVHKSTKNVLNKLGYDVFIPEMDMCCGALHHHSGEVEIAEKLKKNSDDYFNNCDFVVVNSSGCSAELKSNNSGQIQYLDLIEFLSKEEFEMKSDFIGNVVWDAPCHLSHAQKLNNEPFILFEKLGLNPIKWNGQELCCGAAGNYSLNNPKESNEILKLKLEQLSQIDFDYLITSNPGCYLQLEYGKQKYKKNYLILNLIEFIDKEMLFK